MSLDTIAREDLEVAVADLRNAALVVEHAGHHQGSMVNGKTGRVCASAAIEIATWRSLQYLRGLMLHVISDRDQQTPFRTKNAHRVFAAFLPTDLCQKCAEDADPPFDTEQDRDIWRVVHYNDYHCTGGVTLVNMMRLAADEAVNEIADRRKILTGLPA